MTPVIILGAIVLFPVLVLMFLRINATLVFLSLCLGNILVQFIGPDSSDLLNTVTSKVPQASNISPTDSTIKIGLLLLPVALTALFMIRTVKGRTKLLLNAFPAAGVGLLGALLAIPLLPDNVSQSVTDSNIWSQAQKLQVLIVGGSALVCLFVLWLQRPKSGGGHHEEKHSKHKD